MAPNSKKKLVSSNRRAKFNYEIIEYLEAGISLKGSEIKSIREGRVNISEGYVQIKETGAWLHNVHIASYQPAGNNNQHNPTRTRRLLLHKKEQTRIRLEIDKKKLINESSPTRPYMQTENLYVAHGHNGLRPHNNGLRPHNTTKTPT